MQTVELLLDPVLDAEIRHLWGRLHKAGHASLATHTHPTNRPHVTLTTAPSVETLPPIELPLPITLGGPRLLGRALILPVEQSHRLLALHARVWESLADANPFHAPDSWLPHVSLALRSQPEAIAAVAGTPPLTGLLTAARSYDTETRTVTALGVRRDRADGVAP